jgi:hypothetical protein
MRKKVNARHGVSSSLLSGCKLRLEAGPGTSEMSIVGEFMAMVETILKEEAVS